MDFADFISEGFKIFFFRLRDYSLLTLVSIIPLSILIVFAGNASQTEGTEINTIKIILYVWCEINQGYEKSERWCQNQHEASVAKGDWSFW